MSIKYILSAMLSKVGNPSRKLVLIKLSDNANDDGYCYPSYKNIADHCEITRRSVMTHINKLEKDGFLKRSNRKNSSGFTSNGYQLIFSPPSENISPPGENFSPPSENFSPPSENFSPPSENFSPPPGENFSPRTCHSFKPVNEPKDKREKLIDDDLTISEQIEFKPESISDELWMAFIKMRKKRKTTQTERALKGQLRELNLCEKSGVDKVLAIERYLEEKWLGIRSTYFENSIKSSKLEKWEIVPKDDNELEKWAVENGYKKAGRRMTGYQYRGFLYDQVKKRKASGG